MDPSRRSTSREAQPRTRRKTCHRADLPERLRARLVEHGLSQAKLGQHTNIDPSTLSKILNGKRRPNAAQLGALAYVLDLGFDELLVLPSSPNELAELDELRAERDKALRRADEAEAAHRREETARARAELAAADRVAELLSLRTQRDEATRAESAAAERLAELEAKLEDAARAREKTEAELKRVEQELAAAKLRLGEFDFGEPREPKPKSGRSSRPRSTVEFIDLPPPEFNERRATVERNSEMIETGGVIAGKIMGLVYRVLA